MDPAAARYLGLVDELDATQAPYVPSEAAAALLPMFGDNTLNMGVFFLAALARVDLDRSPHYLGIVVMIFALAVVIHSISARLSVVASTPEFHKETLALMISKLLSLVFSFMIGLLAGSLVDHYTAGPSFGHFDLLRWVVPLSAFVLIIVRMYWLRMVACQRGDILLALVKTRSSAS